MAVPQLDRGELDRLKAFLQQIPELGAPDPDEGARLHAEKNAPWINGAYSHLRFPPLVPAEFPKCLFSAGYGDALKAKALALRIPARGTDDAERATRLLDAERALSECVCIVPDAEQEARRLANDWFNTPQEAEAGKEAIARRIATAAAERAYDDRRLGPQAQDELRAVEDDADGHVLDVPAPRRGPGRPRKETTE